MPFDTQARNKRFGGTFISGFDSNRFLFGVFDDWDEVNIVRGQDRKIESFGTEVVYETAGKETCRPKPENVLGLSWVVGCRKHVAF